MKTKFIIILFLLGICSFLSAQGQHTYKPTQCMLGGKPVSWGVDVNRCPACLEIVKKEEAAKAKEDQRVKDIAIKKAEEAKQKAIAESKRQNEAIEAKRKADKENVVHIGVPKQTKVAEVKKEKIITDERYRLRPNKRDGVVGFDDANGEPLLYKPEYRTSDVTDYRGGKYPLGLGKVKFIDGNVDVVNYTGKRYINDTTINEIFHIYDKWFLACREFKNTGFYSHPYFFSSAYFINIETSEKIAYQSKGFFELKHEHGYHSHTTWMAGIDALFVNMSEEYMKIGGSRLSNNLKPYIYMSEYLGIKLSEWKAIIYFSYNREQSIFYYIDDKNKLKKSEKMEYGYQWGMNDEFVW